MKNIAVIGSGAWGTALAIKLANNGHSVKLWSRSEEQASLMIKSRVNARYLPNVNLSNKIKFTHHLAEALQGQDGVVMAVPSGAFKEQLQKVIEVQAVEQLLWVCKGFAKTGGVLSKMVESLGMQGACLSGPTFATEVANNQPTATVIASSDSKQRLFWQKVFHSGTFRCYASSDIIGVQVGGCMKNIIAIAVGASDGLSLGANARSALVTRGLREIQLLGMQLGGQPQSFMGLSGLGDLVLTATDDQSRNRQFGLALANNKTSSSQLVEGVSAAEMVHQLAQKYGLDLPICEAVYAVLYKNTSLSEAMIALRERSVHDEF